MSDRSQKALVRVVVVGHVDHGKSTLIGRLLRDTGHLSAEKIRAIEASGKARGMRTEWAFAMDALQAERDQGLTIDVSQAWFATESRRFCLIDAPGHQEFLKNMVTGASSADAALLLVDAEEGVRDQTRRHALLLEILGIRQLAVIVNKMDRVGWGQARFATVRAQVASLIGHLELEHLAFIPVSAIDGENLIGPSEHLGWYDGPSVVTQLDQFEPIASLDQLPLRVPLQDVYKFDDRRIYAGRVESGVVRAGDEILFSPCHKLSVVERIESFPPTDTPLTEARAGEPVMLTLRHQVFVQRGEVISHRGEEPHRTNTFDARIFWLGRRDLERGRRYRLKLMTQDVSAEIHAIHEVIDGESLEVLVGEADRVSRNSVARVRIRTRTPVALDPARIFPASGRFVLVDDGQVAGGGLVDASTAEDAEGGETAIVSREITWSEPMVTTAEREKLAGHRGAVIWLTGLSGSGKSTVAQELDRQLYLRRCRSYILDGDNVRHGLNRDLGFSHDDRTENIRRIGEVAKLFAEAGSIVITAFISPYRIDRNRARSLCDGTRFLEVHVCCPLDVCESRDPKGLYVKARKGQIEGFTGIDAPYEEPRKPELVVDTDRHDAERCAKQIVAFLEADGIIGSG